MTHTYTLLRTASTPTSTRSELHLPDGRYLALALEDAYHAVKIPHETRIPPGTFPLHWHASPKFDAPYAARVEAAGLIYSGMIQLTDVPDYDDVLLHSGNTVRDTWGCPLLADQVVLLDGAYSIPGGQTQHAFLRAYAAIQASINGPGAELQVIDKDR